MTISETIRVNRVVMAIFFAIMLVAAAIYLIPLYVMLVNSFKPLSEIQGGNMMALPKVFSLDFWYQAWATTNIGVQATGLRPYFFNAVMIVVPAVALSTIMGAFGGFVLARWPFKGDKLVFGLILFGCFIPFQIVLIPSAKVLGLLGLAGTIRGLILIHTIYGLGFTTLFFRNSYKAIPAEMIEAAQIDGAHFMKIFNLIMLPLSGPVFAVSIIWQTTNIWNDFLFGASFGNANTQPIMVALNNLVSSSTGVKEYNVHFAGALMAALPTLLIYIFSGKYFIRGLTSGAVKG
jgi:glucose/mannose transport system permease protein